MMTDLHSVDGYYVDVPQNARLVLQVN